MCRSRHHQLSPIHHHHHARHKDGHSFGPQNEWQYLIRPADDLQYRPTAELWYFEHEVPSYIHLINKYWKKNCYDENVEPNRGETNGYQADFSNDWSGL